MDENDLWTPHPRNPSFQSIEHSFFQKSLTFHEVRERDHRIFRLKK